MSRTYLITGGAGFIGSSLVEKLINTKNKVICIDNFDSFYSKKTKEKNLISVIDSPLLTFIEADIRDKNAIKSVFSNNKIDCVIHLAAKAGVRPSIENPNEYFDVNVNGTLVILELMKENGINKLVFASSSSVYGNNKKIPYSESDNVDFPISPYAASKKCGELITHNYFHLYNINSINLRFFTVYGPKQRPDLAIHKFFTKINNKQPIEIYGDGSTSRDYTYIDDIIMGIEKSIKYLFEHENVYEIINLGNHSPIKLSELVNIIEEVTNKKFEINRMPMQLGDVDRTFADISKATNLLNYKPETNMKEGLVNFKNWFENIESHK